MKIAVAIEYSCLIIIQMAYLGVFAGLVCANRQLQTLKNLDKNAENTNMCQKKRNEVACRVQSVSKKAQKKIRKQVERKLDGNMYQYVPPCEAPYVNDAYEQTLVQPQIQEELSQPLIVEETFEEAEKRLHEQYLKDMQKIRTNYKNEC